MICPHSSSLDGSGGVDVRRNAFKLAYDYFEYIGATLSVFRRPMRRGIEFYRSALNAEVVMLSRFKDAPDPGMSQPGMEEKVMHASFRIGETILMASDGRCEGESRFDGFSLSITVPDEGAADRTFNALAEGGKVEMPLTETFWAPKFGMLEDRFGVGWMISVQHKP